MQRNTFSNCISPVESKAKLAFQYVPPTQQKTGREPLAFIQQAIEQVKELPCRAHFQVLSQVSQAALDFCPTSLAERVINLADDFISTDEPHYAAQTLCCLPVTQQGSNLQDRFIQTGLAIQPHRLEPVLAHHMGRALLSAFDHNHARHMEILVAAKKIALATARETPYLALDLTERFLALAGISPQDEDFSIFACRQFIYAKDPKLAPATSQVFIALSDTPKSTQVLTGATLASLADIHHLWEEQPAPISIQLALKTVGEPSSAPHFHEALMQARQRPCRSKAY